MNPVKIKTYLAVGRSTRRGGLIRRCLYKDITVQQGIQKKLGNNYSVGRH